MKQQVVKSKLIEIESYKRQYIDDLVAKLADAGKIKIISRYLNLKIDTDLGESWLNFRNSKILKAEKIQGLEKLHVTYKKISTKNLAFAYRMLNSNTYTVHMHSQNKKLSGFFLFLLLNKLFEASLSSAFHIIQETNHIHRLITGSCELQRLRRNKIKNLNMILEKITLTVNWTKWQKQTQLRKSLKLGLNQIFKIMKINVFKNMRFVVKKLLEHSCSRSNFQFSLIPVPRLSNVLNASNINVSNVSHQFNYNISNASMISQSSPNSKNIDKTNNHTSHNYIIKSSYPCHEHLETRNNNQNGFNFLELNNSRNTFEKTVLFCKIMNSTIIHKKRIVLLDLIKYAVIKGKAYQNRMKNECVKNEPNFQKLHKFCFIIERIKKQAMLEVLFTILKYSYKRFLTYYDEVASNHSFDHGDV